jgi:hypothetical protein
MKVRELMALLSEMDPDASVYVAIQPEYPFEVALLGIAVRRDFTETDEDGLEDDESHQDRWSTPARLLPGNDVLLVTGEQVRYGERATWDAVRRA